ncbi:MAG: hypothetical protein ACRC4N_10195 [Gammaproteobacteria bacterium]
MTRKPVQKRLDVIEGRGLRQHPTKPSQIPVLLEKPSLARRLISHLFSFACVCVCVCVCI